MFNRLNYLAPSMFSAQDGSDRPCRDNPPAVKEQTMANPLLARALGRSVSTFLLLYFWSAPRTPGHCLTYRSS